MKQEGCGDWGGGLVEVEVWSPGQGPRLLYWELGRDLDGGVTRSELQFDRRVAGGL